MSGQLKKPLELFDKARGDVLSISREDFVEIFEYDDSDFLEVLRGLGKFFAGNLGDPEPEIVARDKRNVGVIKRLIEHQKVNALREYKRKEQTTEAVNSRWSKNHGKKTVSEPSENTAEDTPVYARNTSVVDKIKTKDQRRRPKVESSSLVNVVGESGSRTGGAAAPISPILVDEVEKAKQKMRMLAPNVSMHKDTLNAYGGFKPSVGKIVDAKSLDEQVRLMLPMIFSKKDPANAKERTEWEKAEDSIMDAADSVHNREKNETHIFRAIFHAAHDAADPNTLIDGKPIENRVGFIISRLKMISEALAVIQRD